MPEAAIGRIVHWVTLAGEEYPAVIVRVVNPEVVHLRIFQDTESVPTLESHAARSDDPTPLRWHWPERAG